MTARRTPARGSSLRRNVALVAGCTLALYGGFLGTTDAASAATNSTTCTSTISNTTVTTNLTVPAGTTCQLVNVVVEGNVSVGAGATFVAEASTLQRNLATEGAQQVLLFATSVWGNARFDATVGGVQLCRGGMVPIEPQAACLGYDSFGGTGKFGNVSITNSQDLVVFGGNTVSGNVNCSGNLQGVTNGGSSNRVAGKESGQCAGL